TSTPTHPSSLTASNYPSHIHSNAPIFHYSLQLPQPHPLQRTNLPLQPPTRSRSTKQSAERLIAVQPLLRCLPSVCYLRKDNLLVRINQIRVAQLVQLLQNLPRCAVLLRDQREVLT